jgi:hypothetical protein
VSGPTSDTGLGFAESPTNGYADWGVVCATDEFPPSWPVQVGAAAGQLHPHGADAAVNTTEPERSSAFGTECTGIVRRRYSMCR